MKQLQEKLLALLLIFILSGATASAQKAADKVITFRFLPGLVHTARQAMKAGGA